MEELWQRVSEKKVTALLGRLAPEPPPSLNLRVVRISCDGPHATLGPLLEAARKVEEVLGWPVPLFDQARRRVLGLRRRLLGDVPAGGPDDFMIEAFNRLDIDSDRPSVLVFDAVDAADDATLEALRRMVNRPGWLRIPIVLTFQGKELSGSAAALLRSVQENHGEEAILVAEGEGSAPSRKSIAFDWRSIPADLLRVMRAGALIGSGFEADLVAELLRTDPLDVLEQLQRAVDMGVPLSDRGEGCFYLADAHIDELREGILPSVARAWHKRLAQILSAASAPFMQPPSGAAAKKSPEPAPFAPPPELAEKEEEQAEPAIALEPPQQPAAAAVAPPPSPPEGEADLGDDEDQTRPKWPYSQIFGRPGEGIPKAGEIMQEAAPPEPPAAKDEPQQPSIGSRVDDQSISSIEEAEGLPLPPTGMGGAPERPDTVWVNPYVVAPPPPAPKARGWERDAFGQSEMDTEGGGERPAPARGDGGRAAQHSSAAGDLDSAAAQYVSAMQKAAEAGAFEHAQSYGRKALSVLDRLPISPKRRQLRVRALIELGRLQWTSAGPDASFTLAGALEMVNAAELLLKPDDPPELMAEVLQLTASISYDIGDMSALARALDALTKASRVLMDAGNPLGAARLLNDLAAVYVRMGDPVRAAHLLSESRKIFEEKAANDAEAMLELAETDHLFARIPLHVQARPGRESDALLMGLDHAIAAERTYKKVNMQRELGRVWETMGRLELRRKRYERAAARLSAAISVQDAIGDVIGLARSTAAMSEVLCEDGRIQEAVGLLGDSIALNLEKGSPIGLAFNRKTLMHLVEKAPVTEEMQQELRAVELRLREAEGILGKVHLPGERDDVS